jgi:hypothetical protein
LEVEPMKTRELDARTAYAEVLHAAEAICCDAHESIPAMSPGDVVRQGDIYITCLDAEPWGGVPAGTRQLAPGTTRGARHVAEGDCDVLLVFEFEGLIALHRVVPKANFHQMIGPVIRARGPVTITHPEHGDRTLPGSACYLVTYQRVAADHEMVHRWLD